MLSRSEVRDVDRWAIEEVGVPSAVLMENAGRAATQCLAGQGIAGPVVILCGKGNNGGDGVVVARHLQLLGIRARVFLFADPASLTGDAALQLQIAQKLGLDLHALSGEPDLARLAREFGRSEWIVDALFGTGLAGAIRPPLDGVVELVNESSSRKLAIDIPSGMDADTGMPQGVCVRADHTVTFVDAKKGFANPQAAPWLGKVHVADIGVDPRFAAG